MRGRSIITLTAAAAAVQPQFDLGLQAEIDSLLQTRDWSILRETWRMLNGLETPSDFYQHPMETAKGDSLIAKLSGLFQEGSFHSEELQRAAGMLRSVAVIRTRHLSRIDPSMLTRMMPPWTVTLETELLFSYQERIRTLTELLQQGALSPSEYSAARDTLFEKTMAISLLDILNTSGRPEYHALMHFPDPASATVDTIIQRLELTHAQSLHFLENAESGIPAERHREIVEEHGELMEDVRSMENTREIIRVLFRDLLETDTD